LSSPSLYAIPKSDKGYLSDKISYARNIIQVLYNSAPILQNAPKVIGFDVIDYRDLKFIRLVDEAYKCFLLGMYYSAVSLCSVATERLCYDILENSKINLDDIELDNEQKKAFFKIPYTALVELLEGCKLVTRQMEKDMKKINNSRQKYVHPLLPEDDVYKDAEESINLLCKIIDSYISLKRTMQNGTSEGPM
jgi:hypothetical protein